MLHVSSVLPPSLTITSFAPACQAFTIADSIKTASLSVGMITEIFTEAAIGNSAPYFDLDFLLLAVRIRDSLRLINDSTAATD